MNIIAGDIGGTKSWLTWVSLQGASITSQFEKIYASADFPSAEDLLQQFIQEAKAPAPEIACLALPGPILPAQAIRLTNLDWVLDQAAIQALLSARQLLCINDFQAAAYGLQTLAPSDCLTLQAGIPLPEGVRVITGAGTGLGLAWQQTANTPPFASEAGHSDFSPATAQQERLLTFVRHNLAHVSWERLLSGPGVNRLYQFCLYDRTGSIPAELRALNGAVVKQKALAGDEIALATMQLLTELYGNWVGNIALHYQPLGGLYLAGGITARIQTWLQSERFLQACLAKGRLSDLVQQIPIYLITNTRLGLQGALLAALQHSHLKHTEDRSNAFE